jgi:hypothetical protein
VAQRAALMLPKAGAKSPRIKPGFAQPAPAQPSDRCDEAFSRDSLRKKIRQQDQK